MKLKNTTISLFQSIANNVKDSSNKKLNEKVEYLQYIYEVEIFEHLQSNTRFN